MNLTPASSSDLPSEAILTRVSESGTRLMHTAIFMGAENKPGNWLLATACGLATPDPCIGGVFSRLSFSESAAGAKDLLLEVSTQAHLHMPRRPRREPPLHRGARRSRILRKGAKREGAPVEQVPHGAAQLEVAPCHRERQVGEGIVGQPSRDVLLV